VFHHDYSSVYTEAHDYQAIIDRFTATLAAAEEGGDTSAPANLEGGIGQVPRQQQPRNRGDFARAQARLEALAAELSSDWEKLSATERRTASIPFSGLHCGTS
jgi:hypothetical protein